MLSVKELPEVDPGRVQAKTMTGIGVERDGPVVKLLPEYDEGIGYGSFIVCQGSILPFLIVVAPPLEAQKIFYAIYVPVTQLFCIYTGTLRTPDCLS